MSLTGTETDAMFAHGVPYSGPGSDVPSLDNATHRTNRRHLAITAEKSEQYKTTNSLSKLTTMTARSSKFPSVRGTRQ